MNLNFFEKCKYRSFLNFEKRLKNWSKKSDIWAQAQSFDLEGFFSRNPGTVIQVNVSYYLLNCRLSVNFNIYRSPESPRWPVATSLNPSSPIVRRLHCRSSFMNFFSNFISNGTVSISSSPFVYCICTERRQKIVPFMILNLSGLILGIKTVKLMFFVQNLLLYSRTSSRQSEYIMIKSKECSYKIINVIAPGAGVLV